MGYAEVCVNSPVAKQQTFSYAIPLGMSIDIGQAVLVPFGERLLQGIVLELSDYPAVEETREIAEIIETIPLLSPAQISLARWISQHYLAPLFDAVALMLPPGFERRTLTFITAPPTLDNPDLSSLPTAARHAFDLMQKQGRVSSKNLEKALGKRKAQTAVSQLLKKGLAIRSYELEPVKIRPKIEPFLSLVINTGQATLEVAVLREKRAAKQAALLEFLARQSRPVPLREAREKANCDRATINALVNKGLVKTEAVRINRSPLAGKEIGTSEPLTLTAAQQSALRAIQSALP
ncbi:MAG: hypothetical protein JSW16_02735, partial [Dehalococcoidales bacterium]